jgi:hypothetical protein
VPQLLAFFPHSNDQSTPALLESLLTTAVIAAVALMGIDALGAG